MIDDLVDAYKDLISGKLQPRNPQEVLFVDVYNHARLGLYLGDYIDTIEEDDSTLLGEEELTVIILGYSLGQRFQLDQKSIKTDNKIH